MVFDNADVLSPAELEAYLPPGRGGNILITSCNSAMRSLTSPENSLEVTEMEENDAIELLLRASFLDLSSKEFQAEASKIVKKLFCLPFAIDQAGSYIASGATTIGDYLAKYSEHRKTLLSHSDFSGASKYNRTVYETWELSYKEIQGRAKSNDSHKANAANSAIILLELFPFFHHGGITEEIFFYAALQECKEISHLKLPLASSLLDRRLLALNKLGTWDNFVFREGIRVLLSFSLIKKGPSDCVYAMHPLVHTWGRDRLPQNEKKQCCLMAYVTLSCSLRWDEAQPYGFQRALTIHLRANMEHYRSESKKNGVTYLDDAYAKCGRLLMEQGYSREAESLEIKVLGTPRHNQCHVKSRRNISKPGKIYRGRDIEYPSSEYKKQSSWSGTPSYNQGHGKSNSNISKPGKIHRGRKLRHASSGCKYQNSWCGTPRYNYCHGKFSSNRSKPGQIQRGREAGDASS